SPFLAEQATDADAVRSLGDMPPECKASSNSRKEYDEKIFIFTDHDDPAGAGAAGISRSPDRI
ncbi:MAG: hypothetical protein J6W44_06335, partial [Oscillospiraceae bacterium]|nr:hypothetical protein [Oscillospiraceae bacterium]